MNIRQHAYLARALQDACGGADRCVTLLEETPFAMGRTAMYGCRSSEGGKTMPIGALHLLELECAKPIYSQALVNAGPAPSEAECAISEACEASETMARAQSMIRKAGADGFYDENEKREIEPELQRVEAHVRSIRAGMEGAK
ncbi:hypothetical protein GCM10009093_21570 [Brevundimonas terrae]|uniref:Uncharacterized protein n=1 Tax=Brevundimonas terrae TaxID=363631 RepID=A0ABP3IA82_9CAUL|nr:hypothetical protein [Brevundimonas terrae]NIJ26904.1 hypothetical protein [Brevundimonas terrae]